MLLECTLVVKVRSRRKSVVFIPFSYPPLFFCSLYKTCSISIVAAQKWTKVQKMFLLSFYLFSFYNSDIFRLFTGKEIIYIYIYI